MPSYSLVNPVILGTFPQNYTADSPANAAVMFWNELSGGKYLINSLPKFHFTMKGGNNLHHYSVTESIAEDSDTATWKIDEMNLNLSKEHESKFMKESNKAQKPQSGGKKKTKKSKRHRYAKKTDDDDDSSSSSLSDSSSDSDSDEDMVLNNLLYKRYNDPISYWWYTPSIYRLKHNYRYITYPPVFAAPNKPYVVEYWLPL